MFRVSRQIEFCYGHRLLDYEGKCRHLHGHNGRAVVTFEQESLDDLGMVIDFHEIKDRVEKWIDRNIDHRMLLRNDDPAVEPLLAQGEPLVLLDFNPTAENIAKMIFDRAREEGLPVVQVELWETPKCRATYEGTAVYPRHSTEAEEVGCADG